MELTSVDLAVFVGFMAAVIGISLYAGRKEKSSEDYFLAGRNLGWCLIGFSLIASNISTEHFVGMAGAAFGSAGLAIASYEWMSAIVLVFVAWCGHPLYGGRLGADAFLAQLPPAASVRQSRCDQGLRSA